MVVALRSSALLLVKGDLLGCIVVCGRCSVSQQATQALVFQLFILSYVWRLNIIQLKILESNVEQYSRNIVIIRKAEIMSIKKMLLQYSFPVSKIIKSVGESVEISWTAPFFPLSGYYSIYHTNNENKSIPIISVTSNKVTTQNKKYDYLSQPLNSTNIMFMIRNITLDDAGYYAGGQQADKAWSGGGVVLIVPGKSF